MKFAAVLPAGGVGSRMGADKPKQFLTLEGKPLWRHALEAFLQNPAIEEIALVCHPDWRDYFQVEVEKHYHSLDSMRIRYALGGTERWISVKNGIESLSPEMDFALIHDVARPLLSQAILNQCLQMLRDLGACLVAKPVVDTVKQVQKNKVQATLDRSTIYLAQTPQCFKIADLHKVYAQMPQHPEYNPTDEAGMMEFFGYEVPICTGDELNDKVTTPMDLLRLELLSRELLKHGQV